MNSSERLGWTLSPDNAPPSVEELADYAAAGRSWVAVGTSDQPVGYVIVVVIDGNAHVEQVSVLPDHQGLGVGRALLDRSACGCGPRTVGYLADNLRRGPVESPAV